MHQLEQLLLGGEPRHTRAAAARLAGISLEQASELWHALGFASVADDDVAFTEHDVQALRSAAALVQAGLIDPELLSSVTRMVGQSMSRLAEWQSRLLVQRLADRPDAVPDGDLEALLGQLTPSLEQVQLHVWRRHLAAFTQRLLAAEPPERDPQSCLQAVGFIDLAGYTSLSRTVAAAELAGILEEFETLAATVVAAHRGRVVKTIGDEVLIVAETPGQAAEITLGLMAAAESDGRLPPLRAGLAFGAVLTRFGDVYGPVVNIASRLTALARPGSVLVDQEMATELRRVAGYRLRRMRPAAVRGYHHLQPYRLRRGPPEPHRDLSGGNLGK